MTTATLTLWDFDDTLANSYDAVKSLSAQNPEVEGWKWWHIAELSTAAAMLTAPIVDAWKRLAEMPGEHAILTGRNGEATEAWLAAHADCPVIGDAVKKITKVVSTSHNGDVNVPRRSTADKKADYVASIAANYAEITFYDDSAANVKAVAAAAANVKAVKVGTDLSKAQG